MADEADLLFINGPVVTVDTRNHVAEALVVRGNRIAAVGARSVVEALRGPGTRVVDLRGRALLPGFVEAHNHMSNWGTYKTSIDCKAPHIRSIRDILDDLERQAAEQPAGTWIRAMGYNDARLSERRHPTREDLDAIASHPVVVQRTCGHISAINTKAIETLGLREDEPDPSDGKFGRRPDGTLNGVLYEGAQRRVRESSRPDVEGLRACLRRATADWLACGITSAHDAGAVEEAVPALLANRDAGEVKVRTYFTIRNAPGSRQGPSFLDAGVRTGFGDPFVRVGPFKMISDGSSSGPTAATRQPYRSQRDFSGLINFTQEELDRDLGAAFRRGFQITTHAVGDLGIEMTLNAIERAQGESPRPGARNRIEHCGICPPDLQARIRRLGVVPVIQPAFFYEFGDIYLDAYGPERVRHMFPARAFLDQGIVCAGSSDAPVTRVEPLFGIWCALNRVTESGQSCGAEERITLLEAIRLFTYNGAYAEFQEHEKGSLEPGKLADLIVLSDNILGVGTDAIRGMTVDMTVVDGQVAYER